MIRGYVFIGRSVVPAYFRRLFDRLNSNAVLLIDTGPG